jgi:hypothetical protein
MPNANPLVIVIPLRANVSLNSFNGLGQVYPRRHASLAQQIVDNGGALVSEFPLITARLAWRRG